MIDLEAIEYKDEIPKEEGWYPIQNKFEPKQKLIAEFNGNVVLFIRSGVEPSIYLFGPKIANRIWTEMDYQMQEVGLK